MERRNFLGLTALGSLGLMLPDSLTNNSLENRYKVNYLGQPCRNFNILAKTTITDPADGKEKLVLSNFAEGELGSIVIIDIESGKGENIPLPIGAGGWGLVNYKNEKIIVGTCTEQAYLHVFDLKTREWAVPIVSKNESYFWQMGLASDGKIYGGTYPGCALTQYDPETNEFKTFGRVSDNTKNLYTRPVYCQAPGYVFVWYGFVTQGIKVYDIKKDRISDFGKPGDAIKEVNEAFICTTNNDILTFYDAKTLAPIPDDAGLESKLNSYFGTTFLKDGRIAGVSGQEYYIIKKGETLKASDLKHIPVDAMPTAIFNLTFDDKGVVWGSCAFGLTIFKYDPATKKYWNSSGITKHGGEVYGMVWHKKKLYTSAYSHGEISIYDPRQDWNVFDNKNPRTVATLAPKVIRPEARSVMGPGGKIWTGWSANYGTYGGGISSLDPVTLKNELWYDPIPGQTVAGLTTDGKLLYFTTNGTASGLPYKEGVRCHFSIWEPGKGVVFDHELKPGEYASFGILYQQDLVSVVINDQIWVFDPQKRTFIRKFKINSDGRCIWMIRLKKGMIGAFAGTKFLSINPATGDQKVLCDLPRQVEAATILPNGKIYFSCASKLYEIA